MKAMNLTPAELSKADPSLRDALARAEPGDNVRVLMTLGSAAPSSNSAGGDVGGQDDAESQGHDVQRSGSRHEPGGSRSASHNGSRSAGEAELPLLSARAGDRQKLIEHRRAALAAELGEVLDSLRGLSLTVHGGTLGRVVVAEGAADKIKAGLRLPAVRRATLDQDLQIDRPRSHKSPSRAPEASLAPPTKGRRNGGTGNGGTGKGSLGR